MRHGRRWSDGGEARPEADGPASPEQTAPSSLYERLSAACEQTRGVDSDSSIAWLREEAEARVLRLLPELARAGLHAMAESACGTFWSVHCIITGARVHSHLTLYQLEHALLPRLCAERASDAGG